MNQVVRIRDEEDLSRTFVNVFPVKLIEEFETFVLDKKTGNIEINLKDGRIMGYHVKRIEKTS